MSSTQSSFEVDQVFWNDIMIVIIVFVSMSRFVDETSSFVDNNFLQSVIKSVENVNYFDFDYENSFDTNQFIVNSKRHNFYRDVFIFTDHLKDLKKIFSNFRLKKLIVICLKKMLWFDITRSLSKSKKISFEKLLSNVDVLISSNDSKNELQLLWKNYRRKSIFTSMFVVIASHAHICKTFFDMLEQQISRQYFINVLSHKAISSWIFVHKYSNHRKISSCLLS